MKGIYSRQEAEEQIKAMFSIDLSELEDQDIWQMQGILNQVNWGDLPKY